MLFFEVLKKTKETNNLFLVTLRNIFLNSGRKTFFKEKEKINVFLKSETDPKDPEP